MSAARWLQYELRRWAGEQEGRFRVLYGRRERSRRLLVRAGTDVLIEGFPRSANTFAVLAFERDNPGCRLAHHLHVPAQFERARRLDVPALLLLRTPADTVVSYALRAGVGLGQALRHYTRFHECLLPLMPGVVVAPFERVTHVFHEIVEALNAHAGTTFRATPLDAAAQQAIFDNVDRGLHDGVALDLRTSRPHAGRREAAAALHERLASEGALQTGLERALAVHRAVTEAAAGGGT